MKLLSLLLFALAIGNGVLAAVLAGNAGEAAETAMRAEGRVVEMERRGIGRDATYAPVVTFTAEGAQHTFTSSVSSRPPAYQVGEQVTVLYPKGQPQDAWLDSFFSNYFPSIIFAVLAGALTISGLVLLLMGTLRARNLQVSAELGD